ncbi:hypothetical protein LCGC14_2349820 [marine sediment metagenome]|uniref:Uncharacterized protein n=1 Tax=marine sediment metagenome TaxID=412755 RepID=A0A0F9CA39_9ZZZZ
MRSTSQRRRQKPTAPSGITVTVGLIVLTVLGGLAVGVGAVAVWGIQQAWNGFVPAAFGGPALTFFEAASGVVLAIVGVMFLSVLRPTK